MYHSHPYPVFLLNTLLKLTLLSLVLFVFTQTTEAKTIKRGDPATLSWSVGVDSYCTPDFQGNFYPSIGDGVRSAWVSSLRYGAGNVTFPSVWGDNGQAFPQTYTFACRSVPGGVLGTSDLTITDCLAGETWNGSACVANSPTPTPTPTATLTVPDCTTPAGASSCAVSVSYNATGQTGSLEVGSCQGAGCGAYFFGSQPVSAGSGSISGDLIPNGHTGYAVLRHVGLGDSIAEDTGSASCGGGSAWNGSICACPASQTPSGGVCVASPNPTITQSRTPNPGTVGQSFTNTWSTTNATRVYANCWGAITWNGYLPTGSTQTGSYAASDVGTTYCDWVAQNETTGQNSATYRETLVINAVATPPTAPTAPTPIATPGACGSGLITITWPSSTGADYYQVIENGSGLSGPEYDNSFTHTGLIPGSSHSYTISAYGNSQWSGSGASSVATAPADCPATPYPDLIANPPTLSTNNVTIGNTLSFTGSIRNSGNAVAGPYTNGVFYIDYNNDGNGDYTTPASGVSVNTGVGTSNNTTGAWTVPDDAPVGANYRVAYFADIPSTVDEGLGDSDWVNFSGWSAMFTVGAVGTPPTAPTGYNAVLQGCGTGQVALNWNPAVGLARYDLYVNGAGPTSIAGNATTYTVSGLTANQAYTFDLYAINGAGQSAAARVTANAPANCVAPTADLVADVPILTDNNVNVGSVIYFSGSIINSGAALAGPYTNGVFYIDYNNDGVGDYTTPASGVNASTPIGGRNDTNGAWLVPVGAPTVNTYRVAYFADIPSTVDEGPGDGDWVNFSGWSSMFTVNAVALPLDLTVTNLTPASSSFINTSSMTLSGRITNAGPGNSPQAGVTRIDIDSNNDGIPDVSNDAYGGFSVGPLASSVSANLSYTYAAGTAPGNYAYRFRVDITGVQTETDEGNNTSAWTPFVVTATFEPDLNVTASTFPAGPLEPGVPVTLSGTVTNSGTAPTGSGFSNNFSYDTGFGWTNLPLIPIGALGTGATAAPDTQSHTPAAPGNIRYQYCTDSSLNITESNEANNCVQSGWLPIVIPQPDTPNPFTGATGSCGGGIDLTWGAATGATTYEISLNNGSTWPYTGIVGTTLSITGLPKNTTYSQVRLRARNDGGVSAVAAGPVSVVTSDICQTLIGTGCNIPDEANSCSGRVSWDITGATSPNVRNLLTGSTVSNNASGTNIVINLNYKDNTIEARDGASVVQSVVLEAVCGASSFFHTGLSLCKARPDITILPNPVWIRSGQSATLRFVITANYNLSCTFNGQMSAATPISHTGGAVAQTYLRDTDNLTAAQVVRITCTAPGLVPAESEEVRVNVLPAIQET